MLQRVSDHSLDLCYVVFTSLLKGCLVYFLFSLGYARASR